MGFRAIEIESIQIFEGSRDHIGLEFIPVAAVEPIRVYFEAGKVGDVIDALQRWHDRTFG